MFSHSSKTSLLNRLFTIILLLKLIGKLNFPLCNVVIICDTLLIHIVMQLYTIVKMPRHYTIIFRLVALLYNIHDYRESASLSSIANLLCLMQQACFGYIYHAENSSMLTCSVMCPQKP